MLAVTVDVNRAHGFVSGDEIRDRIRLQQHQRGGPDFRQGGLRAITQTRRQGRDGMASSPPGWRMWLPWMPVPEALRDWLEREMRSRLPVTGEFDRPCVRTEGEQRTRTGC